MTFVNDDGGQVGPVNATMVRAINLTRLQEAPGVTRIAIAGIGGRMGQALLQAVHEAPATQLGAASEQAGHPWLGKTPADWASNVTVVADLAQHADQFDTLIDFTRPQAALIHAALCAELGKRLVVGTTGLTSVQETELKAYGAHIPLVFAPNMSVGVNLSFKLVEIAARVLADSADIEIIEAHHRHKVDAPSGTALRLGRVIAEALGRDLATDAVFGREGQTGARDRRTIGFATVRGGDIVGEHTTLFAGEGERLEITHRATNRLNFAHGAVRAAQWLQPQPPGCYDMQDVLGLRNLT